MMVKYNMNSKLCLPEPCYTPTPQPKAQSSPYCHYTPSTYAQTMNTVNGQVRMDSSQYMSKLDTYPIKLNARQLPWNNLSDQMTASIQPAYKSSSRTIVSGRPGALTPGGIGVDVKHGSYDRFLNKLKGKGCIKC
jgi:hypothetical protein